MLSEKQKQFIFKRSLFQKISSYITWSMGLSTIAAWAIIFFFKPEMVNSQAVLVLIKEKQSNGTDISSMSDIAVLAVTGASAVTACFILLLVMIIMMHSWYKKEKQYLAIIDQFTNNELNESNS